MTRVLQKPGAVGLVLGTSWLVLAWFWLPSGDKTTALAGAAGVMMLSWSLVLVALPTRALTVPIGTNEQEPDDAQQAGWTVLGRALQGLSFLVGVGAYVCLRTGS